MGSLQEVTVIIFFTKTNLESSLQHQDKIKKKPSGKGSVEEVIVTTGRSGLVLLTKITYMTS